MRKLKIYGLGRYIAGGVLYYRTNQWPWKRIRQQPNVYHALFDVAVQFGCPDTGQ